MIYLILFLSLFFVTTNSLADRICIQKGTNKLIEYQSGNAPLGTLTQNAINAGYVSSDIEEKYITSDEWDKIKEEQIDKPIREKNQAKQNEKNIKSEVLKNKLKLSEQDWQDLKECLK